MAAAKEKRVPKWYFDEVFSMGVLFRKKTRTRKTSAVDKIGKRAKIHYVEIFGIFEIFFFIFIASLCIVELFLKLLSLGNWILQRLFLRSFLPSFTDLQIIRRESTNLSSHLTYLYRSQTWRIIYQNIGTFSLHSNLAVKLRFQHACTKELRPILERRPWYDTWTPSKISYRNFKKWNLTY